MEKIPTLIVSPPDSEPLTFELHGERVGLGREVDNQIQVDVGALSSCHCEFRKTEGGYELVDLGSTNGSRVNGKIVQNHKLADGDRLLLGETVPAHFVVLEAGESAPTAAIAGGEEESKAAAAYTKMDDKLQSIAANIAAKEAEHKKIATSLEEMREEFEAKKKEHDSLLASMANLEQKIAAKKSDTGASKGAQQEVIELEKELMLQTRRVQVLATDLDGHLMHMNELHPDAAAPTAPSQQIKVASMAPPGAAPAQPGAASPPAATPAAAPAPPTRPTPAPVAPAASQAPPLTPPARPTLAPVALAAIPPAPPTPPAHPTPAPFAPAASQTAQPTPAPFAPAASRTAQPTPPAPVAPAASQTAQPTPPAPVAPAASRPVPVQIPPTDAKPKSVLLTEDAPAPTKKLLVDTPTKARPTIKLGD